MMANKKIKILMGAYQCGPGMGSVSRIGWEWYCRMSQRADVTLVTHIRNKKVLEKSGAPAGNSEIIYVDTEWFAGPLYRLACKIFPKSQHAVFLVSSLDFFVYDAKALRILKRLKSKGKKWDIAHVVTPLTTAAPSRFHQLKIPFIWGPLNSGLGVPKKFPGMMKQDSAWLYPVRNLGTFLDIVIGCRRHAKAILVATRATLASIPKRSRRGCINMIENGVDFKRFKRFPWPKAPSCDNPLRIIFAGRLVPFKGVGMLLEAIARVHKEFPVKAAIVGDGPMAETWRTKTRELRLNDSVTFTGNVSLDKVAGYMKNAHVFCLPSVRESGGAVLLEAMSSCRPVIAIAYGGPAEIVDNDVGCAISPEGEETVVKDMAQCFRDIVRNPQRWKQKGLNGRSRAEQCYSWDRKIEQALEIYRKVLIHV